MEVYEALVVVSMSWIQWHECPNVKNIHVWHHIEIYGVLFVYKYSQYNFYNGCHVHFQKNGQVSLSVRSVTEMSHYIRETFPDCVRDCDICKLMCLQVWPFAFTYWQFFQCQRSFYLNLFIRRTFFGVSFADIKNYHFSVKCQNIGLLALILC